MNAGDVFHFEDAIVADHPDVFAPEFAEWLRDNRPIWQAFERRAHRLWATGSRHAGARMIGETLRYLTALREGGNSQFKINDHHWPDCARLYMLLHPARVGFFETRVQAETKKRAA